MIFFKKIITDVKLPWGDCLLIKELKKIFIKRGLVLKIYFKKKLYLILIYEKKN